MSRRRHLCTLLETLRPADATEAAHRSRMLDLAHSGSDPFGREHYVPGHFTASAFILNRQRDALLLILHQKLGLWLQPGGHIEADDADVIAAARREVHEEVGLSQLALAWDGIFDADVHLIPKRPDAPAHEHFDLRFLFVADQDGARAGSDAADLRWVPLARLREPRAHAGEAQGETPLLTDESVLRAVRKVRSFVR